MERLGHLRQISRHLNHRSPERLGFDNSTLIGWFLGSNDCTIIRSRRGILSIHTHQTETLPRIAFETLERIGKYPSFFPAPFSITASWESYGLPFWSGELKSVIECMVRFWKVTEHQRRNYPSTRADGSWTIRSFSTTIRHPASVSINRRFLSQLSISKLTVLMSYTKSPTTLSAGPCSFSGKLRIPPSTFRGTEVS